MPLFGSSPQEAQNLQEGEQHREDEDGSDSPHRNTEDHIWGKKWCLIYRQKTFGHKSSLMLNFLLMKNELIFAKHTYFSEQF